MASPAIKAHELTKWFGEGEARTVAVNSVSFEAYMGEMFFIEGPSGSGKTTLLSLISGILMPNSGSVLVEDRDIWGRKRIEPGRPHRTNSGSEIGQCGILEGDRFGRRIRRNLSRRQVPRGEETAGRRACRRHDGDGVNDAPALRQAEVGIAISGATDVAKKAASAILLTEGLAGISDLVQSGRETYQRIITWMLNKIIKTFQITVFVILVFVLTGQYVVSALHMILLLFLTDFVTLSLSTDQVRPSRRPDTWNISGLVRVAVCLGILVIAELMIFIHAGEAYFGIRWLSQLQTFTFQALVFIELLDVLIIRERRHFWSSMPSAALLLALALDLLIVFFISTAGFPGIDPIPLRAALAVVLFSAAAVFGLNDPVKVLLVRAFWGPEQGQRTAPYREAEHASR